MRVYGSSSVDGSFGVPVAGGGDVDGDGRGDVALSCMRASPYGRAGAGTVYLVFGSGEVEGTVDSLRGGKDSDRMLLIDGATARENAGSEVWMADVTGDGLYELLVARQNASAGAVRGAGAVSVIVGGPSLTQAGSLDLASPAPEIAVTTLQGSQQGGRVGIWVRAGDATGDGIADLLIGADQEEGHRGAAWLVEGGAHLASGGALSLADAGGPLAGHVLRILGPDLEEAHFGSTVQLGDLDEDGRDELLVSSALNRAGAGLSAADDIDAHGVGGVPHGSVSVLWSAQLPSPPFAAGQVFDTSDPALDRAVSVLTGSLLHNTFGEELATGDFDGDGARDLFVGDLASDLSPDAVRPYSGVGAILYDLGAHAGEDFSLDGPPDGLGTALLLGASPGELFSDTAVAGDITGDGVDDLVSTSPDADPGGRTGAGRATVLAGGLRLSGVIDLSRGQPLPEGLRLLEIWGALPARSRTDYGDMLAYSASPGDIDGDGLMDFVSNEMLGNGLQRMSEDAGNLVVLSGERIADALLGGP